MYKIRKNVFETNSSSSHSISINVLNGEDLYTKDEILNELESYNDDSNGQIHLDRDNYTLTIKKVGSPYFDYGWGYEAYYDFTNKFMYALENLDGGCDFDRFINYIEDFLGYKINITSERNHNARYNQFATIDHQSANELVSYCSGADISIIDFCLNKEVVLLIDNDNR